ncbi:MAG: Uma2 family endonuclease [Armatimonadota bacterium]
MSVQVTRRRFTVDEYHRMGEAGILLEDTRVELLDGEIIEMVPISNRHAAAVRRLIQRLSVLAATGAAVLDVQNPVRLGELLEPQPDVIVLRARLDLYASSIPGPEDVLLLIEVMDSSAAYDRGLKLPLYARAGVPEVWLLDLQGECMEVYRRPSGAQYEDTRSVRQGEAISPEALPDLVLAVHDLLGD